jgi:hypothetical protein
MNTFLKPSFRFLDMPKLNSKQEGLLAGVAAMLVLITNVLNPIVSFIIAFVVLLAFAGYKLFQKS